MLGKLRNIRRINPDFEKFEADFHEEVHEIIVLIGEEGASQQFYKSHSISRYILAYVDVETNELKKGDGRLKWLVSDADYKGIHAPYNFKDTSIYRLKAKKVNPDKLPTGRTTAFYNQLLVVEVIEEYTHHDELIKIAKKYNEKIEIVDKELGTFVLNKKHHWLEGAVVWLGKNISVTLEETEDIYDKGYQQNLLDLLRQFLQNQKDLDLEFRKFASAELTDSANEWRDDGSMEISEESFAQRIELDSLNLDNEGNYMLYFHDDDMFFGHSILVSGNIEGGITDTQMVG